MFKREFKINFKSLILWSVILLAIYILVFAIYPSLINEDSKQSIEELMKTMPQEMLASFNMDLVGLESAFAWFKTEGYTFLTLIGGIYAAILGGTILLKEENDKTIEFLYSKPVSRNNIVTSKILYGIVNIIIFTSIITIGNLIALQGNDDFNLKQFLMISILPILLYYMLFFIMLFISTFMKKTKRAMSLGIGIVFLSYFMQLIGGMGESAKLIKDISLFEFVSSRYILLNDCIDVKYVLIGLLIIVIATLGTYFRYNRKEFLV